MFFRAEKHIRGGTAHDQQRANQTEAEKRNHKMRLKYPMIIQTKKEPHINLKYLDNQEIN